MSSRCSTRENMSIRILVPIIHFDVSDPMFRLLSNQFKFEDNELYQTKHWRTEKQHILLKLAPSI